MAELAGMMRTLNYLWRLLATALSFSFFSLGGLLMSLLVFPPMLLIRDRQKRKTLARWCIHRSFRLFIRFMEVMGIMRMSVENGEQLKASDNVLVLANHPTLIDVVALISLMPNASCVVKAALWRSPFLGGVVRAADYISNSQPEDLLKDCARDLQNGNPLIIFPEGTRTRLGEPLHFLRGASYIALNSGRPLLPVLISCEPTTLTKQQKWYQIPERRFHLRVKILPPENIAQWVNEADAPTIAARKLTQSLEAFFTHKLEYHG
jgi:1-acyl-sn-glycerol-3-phosphate acyltransferase